MTKNVNNTFSDEKRQAHGEPSPVMQAMIEIGKILNEEACEVIRRVSEISPEIAENVQEKVDSMSMSMNLYTLLMSHKAEAGPGEPIKLKQGNKAIVRQRELHADSAVSQALRVWPDYRDTFLHKHNAKRAELDSDLYASFQRMQRALLEAQRHLAALDILDDLEKNLFSERARKGGHAKVRPAAQKEEQRLLDAVVKNMRYNIRHHGNYNKRANNEQIAWDFTKKIFEINEQTGFLKFKSIEDLQAQVQTSFNKLKPSSEDAHFAKGPMRRPLQLNEPLRRMEAELRDERRVLEGGQDVLVYLMEQKFKVLPDEAKKALDSVSRFEDLQPYVDRLLKAESWQEVLGKSDSWREK